MNVPTKNVGGMIVATGLGPQETGKPQNLEGGLLIGAAQKSIATTAAQANHAKLAGAGMRGGALHVPSAPEGGSIPGVSFAGNHENLINMKNQTIANTTYDKLAGTTPYKIGGKRSKMFRGKRIPDLREPQAESTVIGGKHRRKTKKNGTRRRRSKSRTSMGKSRRRHHNSRRINHTYKR